MQTRLIVTGTHLLPKFGRTIDHIRKAGWRVDATVRMQSGRDHPSEEPQALARGIAGIARAVDRFESEIVVVLGDRIEALAGACAAVTGRRLLAHIHGGDRATGDVDDSLRNAITRLAHVHLVASADAGRRLRRMGEEAFRIHQVGAPGLDDIRAFRAAADQERAAREHRLKALLGVIGKRYAVILQHPSGLGARREQKVMLAILRAVRRCGLDGVIIGPNSDPGHDGILEAVHGWTRRYGWVFHHSCTRADYLLLASNASVLVGNSSSGIIESASLGICAVNVGQRQEGRLPCGPGVIDCGLRVSDAETAIRQALVRRLGNDGRSLYGDGLAGPRIADVLERLVPPACWLNKRLRY
ncbi:MAG: hypothetical protein AMXMBFR13_13590 [Phycisphaerae bacterium]